MPSPPYPTNYSLRLPDLAYQILDFNLNALPQPKSAEELGSIANKRDDVHSYYNQYQPLILEETVAVLKTALDRINRKSRFKVDLLPGQDKLFYYENEQATLVILKGENRIDCAKEVGSPRFILSAVHDPSHALRLAIIDISFNSTRITVKGDLEQDLRGSSFEITPLASLINLDRMYSTCEYKPNSQILQKIRLAEVDPWPQPTSEEILAVSDNGLEKLNNKQQQVVIGMTLAKQGLFLLQGPPGTGKTTTIIQLIRKLMMQGERILVCAPSNKAVQVLAQRSMKEMPWSPMLLVGVASKISGELTKIGFDGWIDRHPKKLMELLVKLDIMGTIIGEDEKHIFSKGTKFNSALYWSVDKHLIETIDSIKTIIPACFRFLDPRAQNLNELYKEIFSTLAYYQELFGQFRKISQDQMSSFPSLNDSFKELSVEEWHKSRKIKEAQKSKIIAHRNLMRESYNHLSKLIIACVIERLPEGEKANADLLALAQVLFCTLTTSGRVFLKRQCGAQTAFSTVIFDEAGQAVEAEALIPFGIAPRPRKMILVGDPRQLPATTIARSSQETNFEWSMLWRLMEVNKQPVLSLDVQYRMRSDINHFPSQRYYEGNLVGHESIASRPMSLKTITHVNGLNLWLDVPGREESVETSFMNRAEADCVVRLVAAIRQRSNNCSIGIISFYSGQVALLRKSLSGFGLDSQDASITISSVDGFQGDEKDVIIISAVRANDDNTIGFTGDFRRLNVAITRARDVLVICGNVKTFLNARPNEVQELVHLYRKAQLIKSSQQVVDRLTGSYAGETHAVKMPAVRSIGDVTSALERSKKKRPQKLSRQQREQQQPLHKLYNDEELFTFAKQFVEKMEYEKALERCQSALQVNPGRYEIYLLMAECSGHLEQPDNKQMFLDIAKNIQEELKDPSKKVNYLAPKNVIEASATLPMSFVHAKKKINIRAKLKEARQLSDIGKLIQAEQAYRELLIIDETNPEIMIGLGWSLNKLKRFGEARTEFERSLTVEKTPLAYLGLVISLRYLGYEDEAVDKIYECVEIFPYFRSVRKLQIQHEQKKRPDRFPDSPRPVVSLPPAESHVAAAAPKKSKSLTNFFSQKVNVRRVTQTELDHARDISQRRRNPAAALLEYEKLREREPQNQYVLSGMAWCYHHLRNNDLAIELFEKCLASQKTVDTYLGLSRALWYGDRRKEAHEKITECEQSVEIKNRNNSAYKKLLEFKALISKPNRGESPYNGAAAASSNGLFKQRSQSKPNSKATNGINQPKIPRKNRPKK